MALFTIFDATMDGVVVGQFDEPKKIPSFWKKIIIGIAMLAIVLAITWTFVIHMATTTSLFLHSSSYVTHNLHRGGGGN